MYRKPLTSQNAMDFFFLKKRNLTSFKLEFLPVQHEIRLWTHADLSELFFIYCFPAKKIWGHFHWVWINFLCHHKFNINHGCKQQEFNSNFKIIKIQFLTSKEFLVCQFINVIKIFWGIFFRFASWREKFYQNK